MGAEPPIYGAKGFLGFGVSGFSDLQTSHFYINTVFIICNDEHSTFDMQIFISYPHSLIRTHMR